MYLLVAVVYAYARNLRPSQDKAEPKEKGREKSAYLDGPPQLLRPHQPPIRTRQIRR